MIEKDRTKTFDFVLWIKWIFQYTRNIIILKYAKVPLTGLEPVSKIRVDLESTEYTIPPQGHFIYLNKLY